MAGSDSPSALERGEGSPETLELGNLSSAPTITNSSSSNTTTTTTTSGPSFAGLSGFPGLAALMAEDPQFNLHSCFEAVGIEVLLHSERIVRNNVKRLRHLQNRNSGRPQAGKLGITRGEIRLIRKLRRELTIHSFSNNLKDDFFIKLSTVLRYDEPQNTSVEGIKDWSYENLPSWLTFLDQETNPDELRSLLPLKSPLDRAVMNLTNKRIGKIIFYPFLKNKQDVPGAEVAFYNNTSIQKVSTAVGVCLLGIFFQIPVSLLSYRVFNRGVGIGVALVFCFLFSLFAQWFVPGRTEVVFLLVFAYYAIIGGNIINFGSDSGD